MADKDKEKKEKGKGWSSPTRLSEWAEVVRSIEDKNGKMTGIERRVYLRPIRAIGATYEQCAEIFRVCTKTIAKDVKIIEESGDYLNIRDDVYNEKMRQDVESLLQDYNTVADEAWHNYRTATTMQERQAFLKVLLEVNDRIAKLLQLYAPAIQSKNYIHVDQLVQNFGPLMVQVANIIKEFVPEEHRVSALQALRQIDIEGLGDGRSLSDGASRV
jgi:hypothetical protein